MARPRVREKILVAAESLYKTGGAQCLTTRRIAEEAGVTEASVFNNFSDKAGLIAALIGEVLPQQLELMEAIEAEFDVLEDWLEQVFVCATRFFQLVLPFYTASQQAKVVSDNNKGDRFTRSRHALRDRLQVLNEQQRFVKNLDAELVSRLLMGLALHTALTQQTLADGADTLITGSRLAETLGIHG